MSKSTRRFTLRIALGVCALALLVYTAADQFSISRDEILSLFGAAVLMLLAIMLSAATVAALWVGLRRLLKRGD